MRGQLANLTIIKLNYSLKKLIESAINHSHYTMNGKGQTKANWTKHASTKLQVCGVEIYVL